MESISDRLASEERTALPSGVEEHDLGYARPMRVVCVGAGASGLDIAYKVNRHLKGFNLQIYEKNPEIGGTWYENTYVEYTFRTCHCVN